MDLRTTLVDSVRVKGCPGESVRVGYYMEGFS